MPSILRNILGVLIGAAACIFLNGVLLGFMMKLVGTPEGFDPNDLSTYHLLQAKHYLSPFVAHSVPSLIGAAITALIAATRKMTMALIVGGLHLLGGIAAVFLIDAPLWFDALDLTMYKRPNEPDKPLNAKRTDPTALKRLLGSQGYTMDMSHTIARDACLMSMWS